MTPVVYRFVWSRIWFIKPSMIWLMHCLRMTLLHSLLLSTVPGSWLSGNVFNCRTEWGSFKFITSVAFIYNYANSLCSYTSHRAYMHVMMCLKMCGGKSPLTHSQASVRVWSTSCSAALLLSASSVVIMSRREERAGTQGWSPLELRSVQIVFGARLVEQKDSKTW